MDEYIKRGALLKSNRWLALSANDIAMAKSIILGQPAADVVEVVRCKDCKHFTAGYCCRDINGRSQMHYMGESAFCSYGAKMDGKGDTDG